MAGIRRSVFFKPKENTRRGGGNQRRSTVNGGRSSVVRLVEGTRSTLDWLGSGGGDASNCVILVELRSREHGRWRGLAEDAHRTWGRRRFRWSFLMRLRSGSFVEAWGGFILYQFGRRR